MNRSGLLPLLGILFTCLLPSSPAPAGEVRVAKIGVKGSETKGDSVSLSGILTSPGSVREPAVVRFRFGDFEESLSAPNLVQSAKGLGYKAPKGTTSGIFKFALSAKTGKFKLSAKGVKVGALAGPVTITLDVGGEVFSALAPLAVKGTSGKWKTGQPLQTVLTGRVFEVGHTGGNTVLGPAGGVQFVRNDTEEPAAPQAVVVGGSSTTDADGNFELVLEYSDPTVLRQLELGYLLGESEDHTRPGVVPGTMGENGVLEAVCFIQPESGVGGEIGPGAPTTFEVEGEPGEASGTLHLPEGAVPAVTKRSVAPTLSFTPYQMAAELPAVLPSGYRPLAGAEVKGSEELTFDPAHLPTVELSRPSWTEKAPLSGATIRLLQYIDGQWREQPGHGMYNPATDRFVPDPFDPAGLAAVAPVVYAAEVSDDGGLVQGTVVDDEGNPLAGQTVLTRTGSVVSGLDGSYSVPSSTLTSDSLEVLQVIGVASSSALVVTAEEAESPVTLEVEGEEPTVWTVGVVQGTVTDGSTGQPVEGAVVTLALAGLVRGLSHDDGGTPSSFADDFFSVPNLGALGVLSYEWSLYTPGEPEPFVSSLNTKNSVSPTLLMLEAQLAGRSIPDGAYTVRLRYTLPYLGARELFGGFRVTTEDLDLTVSDIQLPAGYETSPSVEATTDSLGQYMKFYRAPEGIPMTAHGECPGGNLTNTRSFVFGAYVTVDLETDGPPPPESIPVGWSVLAPMPETRQYGRIAALGGKVYAYCNNLNRTVYCYDPATNEWTTVASTNALHQVGECVAVGGRLWALGGRDSSVVESYDPVLNAWTTRAAMSYPREGFGASVLNGRILAIAGCTEHTEHSSGDPSLVVDHVEQYSLTENAWTAIAPIPDPRVLHRTAVVDGTLYVLGGQRTSDPVYSSEVLAYSPLTNTWTTRSPIPAVRFRGGCAVLNGEIYYTGGYTPVTGGNATVSSTWIYNPATDAWRKGPDMPGTRAQHGVAVAGGVMYLVGGMVESSYDAVLWAYRPE